MEVGRAWYFLRYWMTPKDSPTIIMIVLNDPYQLIENDAAVSVKVCLIFQFL